MVIFLMVFPSNLPYGECNGLRCLLLNEDEEAGLKTRPYINLVNVLFFENVSMFRYILDESVWTGGCAAKAVRPIEKTRQADKSIFNPKWREWFFSGPIRSSDTGYNLCSYSGPYGAIISVYEKTMLNNRTDSSTANSVP
jgi:hypothetical protein